MIAIKQLTPKESLSFADEIVTVYRNVWLNTYVNDDLGITRRDLESKFSDFTSVVADWNVTILGDQSRGYWIVQDEAQTVRGFGIVHLGETENELEYIYLLPEVQGHGIGDQLMKRMMTFMGKTKPIVLYGAAYNKRAIRFYMKYGFTLSNIPIEPKTLPSGKEIPSMKMTL